MKICTRCVLPETLPGISFDEDGVCNICNAYHREEKETAAALFSSEAELIVALRKYKSKHNQPYDVLVPLSGGVDSSNVLIDIVEKYQLKPLVYHNDHGFEQETATQNVKKLCHRLGVDLIIMQRDQEFMKKLWKYINESMAPGLTSCYVCGNILYINALEIAAKFSVPLVINGYSKGQALMVDNKEAGADLLEQLLEIIRKTGDRPFFEELTNRYQILGKRKSFQSKSDLETPEPGMILVIPFYLFHFYQTDKEVLREKIKGKFDWRPLQTSYPGRTTNCEMVWLNTYMDLQKMGYTAYHIEYAELVRRGEISRNQALLDLEFKPDPELLKNLAREVGVDLNYFQTAKPKDEETAKQPGPKIEFDF